MTPASRANMERFYELARRFNQLGCWLPAPGDIDPDDIEAVAAARMIIAEMHKTRTAMDAVLAAEAKLRSTNG